MVKCLVVDDDELGRELIATYLDGLAYCEMAENGAQAVEMFRNAFEGGTPYDLIILDIVMPEMDGFDVMHALHEDGWGKTVPVIFLTNSSSIETVAEAVSTGMSEFLVKTEMSLDQVVEHVRRRLG